MFEGCTRKNGVALLDVDLHFLFQTELNKEAIDGGHVEIILVLGGFLWLWLDQDRTFEADLVLVFDDLWRKRPAWSRSAARSVFSSVS